MAGCDLRSIGEEVMEERFLAAIKGGERIDGLGYCDGGRRRRFG
jgi:hypothetical protein